MMNQAMIDAITEIARTLETFQRDSEEAIDMQLSNESLEFEDNSNFQKEISFNKLLPYADELDNEADKMLARIKANLGRCVMERDIKPGAVYWTIVLNRYTFLYGMRFTKEEHLNFIKLLFDLTMIPNSESSILEIFATALTVLLKKKDLISPNELELPWKPLYNLIQPIHRKKTASMSLHRYSVTLETTLERLIYTSKVYFPASATKEILDELKPKLCPLDSKIIFSTMKCFKLFLPVTLPPEYHSVGYKLWFDEFIKIWEVCHNAEFWENDLMHLMAKLASHNIGYINWEPYLPIMFTRFVRSLNLPVCYKKISSNHPHKNDMGWVAEWIISTLGGGSAAQSYLDKFLKTIETYYHPANLGTWLIKLDDLFVKLSFQFVHRLHKERFAKRTWEHQIPDSHKLTEEDIDNFVNSMMPVAMIYVFNKSSSQNFHCQALQYLALIRPNIIIPSIFEKVYPNLGSDIEPHKLITAMTCLVSIARPLVQGARSVNKDYGFQEGPMHVLPILFSALAGIDPNDYDKCMVTFRLIGTYVMMIPLADCSKATTDLTEDERLVCEETPRFEDFILQLMDKVFILIESCTLEMVRLETRASDGGKNCLEAMLENMLFGVFSGIFLQTSDTIFQSALSKLRTYISENTLETKVAGQLVAVLCRVFSRINGSETLHALLPFLTEKILNDLGEGEEVIHEENLDNQFLYSLLLLHRVVETDGNAILPYKDVLIKIIDKVIHLKSLEGNQLGCQLLKNVLSSLTTVIPIKVEKQYNDPSYPYIREWGETIKVKSSRIKWYIPGESELSVAKDIFFRYFIPAIEAIQNYISTGGKSLSRDDLKTTLNVLIKIVQGCDSILPIWTEPPIVNEFFQSCIATIEPTIGTKGEIKMPDGTNIKQFLVGIIGALQEILLNNIEDDTKSLLSVAQIWHDLILGRIKFASNMEYRRKRFRLSKKGVEDKLVGNKGYFPTFLLERVDLQHEFRRGGATYHFTETHKTIMLNLLKLSTSKYSRVRSRSQTFLCSALDYFPYAYLVLSPHVIEIIQRDTELEHDAYKGALYLMVHNPQHSLVLKRDWQFLSDLWPALILSKPSEKPSVIRLKDYIIDTLKKNYLTANIFLEVPENCVISAAKLWEQGIKPELPIPTETEIKNGIARLEKRGECNFQHYNSTLEKLLDAILEKNLHWRHRLMALNLIEISARPEHPYPPKVIRYFLNSLIHDSIHERKIAIKVIACIFKQLKRNHPKITIKIPTSPITKEKSLLSPGVRQDNQWLQYNYSTRPINQEQWDEPRYIHKMYLGFYTWPKEVEIYAPSAQQPLIENHNYSFSDGEKEINAFFSDKHNVDKLLSFLSLEDKKGKDKFNLVRMLMFKGMFRNHGDMFLSNFLPHLETFVSNKQESLQRCAAEIICGAIRGSKHWSYRMTCNMWDNLLPIVRLALSNLTTETIADWAMCYGQAHKNRDPNRLYWLLECLMEEPPLGLSETSFIECGRLLILQNALAFQSWKMSGVLPKLLIRFENRLLENPFQNVRDRLASMLVSIFNTSLPFNDEVNKSHTGIEDFINKIYPKLETLVEDSNMFNEEIFSSKMMAMSMKNDPETLSPEVENIEKEKTMRLFKTVCKWMQESLLRSHFGGLSIFYHLYPLICQLENSDTDEELSKTCSRTLAVLAQSFTLPQHVPEALLVIKKISQCYSWSARVNCAEFLQVLIFHNMSILISNTEWILQIQNIVLRLIEDENVQVREKAAQVLGGLLHCTLLPEQLELLDGFKKKARIRINKRKSSSMNESRVRNAEMINALRLRHAGVLGMCAFIHAHPYDVPKYIPPIFECLSSHLNDPEPVPGTIRKIINDFKRTHCDGWSGMQGLASHFTEEEFAILQDLTVPPSYYA